MAGKSKIKNFAIGIMNYVNSSFSNVASFFFDGVNDSFNAANNTIFDNTSGFTFTISGWYYSLNNAITMTSVSKRNNIAPQAGWNIVQASQKLRIIVRTDATNFITLTTTNDVITSTSTAYKVMFVISDTKANCKIIVNDVSQALTDTSSGTLGSITNTGIFSIGSLNNASQFWNGYWDEFRFWNSDQSVQSTADYNGGVAGDSSLLSPPPEHEYRAENNGTDTGSVGGFDLTASGGATYGAGIP